MLYLCATPIGNLGDITLRVIETLREVDVIAAEDTRRTLRLLNHLGIKKRLISYHEHNKQASGDYIISLLEQGQSVALVSDAGMPCISDPGREIVQACVEREIEFEVLPGASACVTALAYSAFDTTRFHFEGFLPRRQNQRIQRLQELERIAETMIFYESPHRILKALQDMQKVFGERKIEIYRELTKKFQEVLRLTLEEAISLFLSDSPKGEFVIIIEGYAKETENSGAVVGETLNALINSGVDKKTAIQSIAQQFNLPKKEVYKLTISDC